MKQFSVPMALVDYIPVILFALGAVNIQKDLKGRTGNAFGLLSKIGMAFVAVAGFLKATYKLLYALHIGDFLWMSNQFFSNQAIGFLLAGIGLMGCVMAKKGNTSYAFLPTMALVGIMVVGLGAMDAALCYVSNHLKNRKALVMYIVSFFLCLMMGYLSSRDFDKAVMNWIAQLINVCGQGLFYLGSRELHKSGLNNY